MSVQKPVEIKLIDSQPIVDACYQQEFCFSYDWSLQISKSGADGNPLVTLETSEDGVNWDKIHDCATNVEMDEDSVTFIHDILPSKYFRVCVNANGVTTGTIKALMLLKTK
jgi:hypothetical protein